MIARKSALIVVTQFANGILGFVALKFISKFMQPWEYGVVGFAYGFVAIFSIFGNLGFNAAHIKRISEGKDMGNCIATYAIIKTFLTALLALAVILSIAIWRYIMHRGFESPVNEKAIYIMLSYFALATLSSVMISTFNARKEIAKARIPYST
ncbi:MAG: flippase, partial [Thermoplasmata archaeon]